MCEDCCGDCVIWIWRVFSFSEYENSTVEEHSIAFVQVLMKRIVVTIEEFPVESRTKIVLMFKDKD